MPDLPDLFASGIIEKGRQFKLGAGHNYYNSAALVAFTRFNFLLRRCFFRTMHRDLNAILDGLRILELRGVECWIAGEPSFPEKSRLGGCA